MPSRYAVLGIMIMCGIVSERGTMKGTHFQMRQNRNERQKPPKWEPALRENGWKEI
jgi:hypothetical protein